MVDTTQQLSRNQQVQQLAGALPLERPMPPIGPDFSGKFVEMQSRMAEAASSMMSERSHDWPSLAIVAKSLNINRTNAYHYFHNQAALMGGIKAWVVWRLMNYLAVAEVPSSCLSDWVGFVLDHPAAMKLLIDDLIQPGEIRQHLPEWDDLVHATQLAMRKAHPGEDFDAEVQLVWMLAGAIHAPSVLMSCIGPQGDRREVIERFRKEQHRLLW